MKRLVYIFLVCTAFVGCITEDFPSELSPNGTFEAVWRTLDEHYCFFDYKDVDWQEVHDRYRTYIRPDMKRQELFDTLARMTYELRDGHVNLISSQDVSRYGAWYDDYPMNFSDSLLHKTLGRSEDYRSVGILQYRILLPDSVGYVRVPSFDAVPSVASMTAMINYLSQCQALIIDVRNNGGGSLVAASTLASTFLKERTLVGYMQHKTGPGHHDFSAPRPIHLEPSEGSRWLRPVVILTNRRTYSAANSFVMYMHPLPHVVTVGDRTGGGSGMPFTTDIPGGWGLRFSASPMLTPEMEHTEFGIEPDVHADITPSDYQRSVDTILEVARKLIDDYLKMQSGGK